MVNAAKGKDTELCGYDKHQQEEHAGLPVASENVTLTTTIVSALIARAKPQPLLAADGGG